MASTLLMKMIATDDRPFSPEIQEANAAELQKFLNLLKQGTKDFAAAKYLSNALNYVFGFMKAGFVGDDISEVHEAGARALGSALDRKPLWKATDEEAEAIQKVLTIWQEIISQASENLIRQIQHQVDTVRPEAKKLKHREKMRRNQRRMKVR